MWIYTGTRSIDYHGKPIAFVKDKINLFGFRLKSEVTLVNSVRFIVTSNKGETNEAFERRVQIVAFEAWMSYLNSK